MNLMRPGSLSQIAVILRMKHISKAGRGRSSFVDKWEPPERLVTPPHKLRVGG